MSCMPRSPTPSASCPRNTPRALWERLDEILTAGGPECLPAAWDANGEPARKEREIVGPRRGQGQSAFSNAAPMLFHMKASFQPGRPLAQPLRATITFSWEIVRVW